MKQLLYDVRHGVFEIKSLTRLKSKLEQDSLVVKGSPLGERVSGGRTTDLYTKVDEYIDLGDLISLRLKTLHANKIKAFAAISALQNPFERVVLIERYINAKSWKVIAGELNLSTGYLHKLHRQAILHLNEF